MFEFALMADGVAPDDLYPLDLARATAKLDTIKDDIVFWASGAESQELIGSGEVAMSMMWNGRAWSAKNIDQKPVEIQWNQQIVTADYFVVPKGTPNKEAAMRFIAYATCADEQRQDVRAHPVRADEHQLGGERSDGRRPVGDQRRRELGVLRRRVPRRQLRRDRQRLAGVEGRRLIR